LKLIRNQNGSLSLEATLVLPLFIAFLLFLIAMIQVARVEMALHNAAYETTKQIAAHMYPVQQLAGKVVSAMPNEEIEAITRNVPDELLDFLMAYIEQKEKELLKPVVRGLMTSHFMDKKILNAENIYVTDLTLPKLVGGKVEDGYFGIEVEYRHRLLIPFFDRELVLKKRARELCWISFQ
jgi:hypothetical protein